MINEMLTIRKIKKLYNKQKKLKKELIDISKEILRLNNDLAKNGISPVERDEC
jgi:hypothetical protein